MTYDLTELDEMLSCIVNEIKIVQDHIQEIVRNDPLCLAIDSTLHLKTNEIAVRGRIVSELIVFKSISNAVRKDQIPWAPEVL